MPLLWTWVARNPCRLGKRGGRTVNHFDWPKFEAAGSIHSTTDRAAARSVRPAPLACHPETRQQRRCQASTRRSYTVSKGSPSSSSRMGRHTGERLQSQHFCLRSFLVCCIDRSTSPRTCDYGVWPDRPTATVQRLSTVFPKAQAFDFSRPTTTWTRPRTVGLSPDARRRGPGLKAPVLDRWCRPKGGCRRNLPNRQSGLRAAQLTATLATAPLATLPAPLLAVQAQVGISAWFLTVTA
jgi:hypothetical protein